MQEEIAREHVSVVTGAGRGIGRQIALRLGQSGSSVGVFARSAREIDEVADLIRANGGRSLAISGDVRVETDVRRLMSQVATELGAIDLLVNNAGLLDGPALPWEIDPTTWWAVVETNLRGPFLCSMAVVPAMIERGSGRIININSMSGAKPLALNSAYSTSKAALMRFTETLDVSLEATPVRVFDYSPGSVKTSLNVALHETRPAHKWNSMERAIDGVLALASGRYDCLSGRLIDARDDLDELRELLTEATGRRLRLAP